MYQIMDVAKPLVRLATGILLMASGTTDAFSLDLGNSLKIDGLGQSTLHGVTSPTLAPSAGFQNPGLPWPTKSGGLQVRVPAQLVPDLSPKEELRQLRRQEQHELDWFAGSLIMIGTAGISEDDVEEASTTFEDIRRDGQDHILRLNNIRKRIRELGGYPVQLPVFGPAVGNDPSYGVDTSDRGYHAEPHSDPTEPSQSESAPDITVGKSIFHDELMRQGFPEGSFDGNNRGLRER